LGDMNKLIYHDVGKVSLDSARFGSKWVQGQFDARGSDAPDKSAFTVGWHLILAWL